MMTYAQKPQFCQLFLAKSGFRKNTVKTWVVLGM